MDSLDLALANAWHRLSDTVRQNRLEAARRADRRRGILSRNIRPWSLALRAADTRLDHCHALIFPDEHAIRDRRPHTLTLDAPTIRKLCRPVYIPWPGVLTKHAAARFGATTTLINRWVRRGRLATEKGTPYLGRCRTAVWTPSPLDPANDLGRGPHPVWGSLWQHLHTLIPDDLSITITRIPVHGTPIGRRGTPHSGSGFRGWAFLCPRCTDLPPSLFNVDPDAFDDPASAIPPTQPIRGPRPPRAEPAQIQRDLIHQFSPCAFQYLYLPLRPWTLDLALDLPHPLHDPAITSPDFPPTTPHSSPPHSSPLPTPRRSPFPPHFHPFFACRSCQRIQNFSLTHPKSWNLFIAHISGGLLYGADVPMPDDMIQRRRRPANFKRPREDLVFELLFQGLTYHQIAARLGVTTATARSAAWLACKRRGLPTPATLLRTGQIKRPLTLTPRQSQFLAHLRRGTRRPRIAQLLGISYCQAVYTENQLRKLFNATTRAQLLQATNPPPASPRPTPSPHCAWPHDHRSSYLSLAHPHSAVRGVHHRAPVGPQPGPESLSA
jgi:DNA-binding CsgD family transcriptional regulator